MRVSYFGTEDDFSPSTGEGTQRYGYNIYKHMKEKIDSELVTSNSRLGLEKEAFMHRFESDIIHMPNFRLVYPKRKKPGSAVIITEHDFQPILYPEFNYGEHAKLKTILRFKLVGMRLKSSLKADCLICNSSQTRNEAIKLGFDAKKAFVTNLGIDDRFAKPMPEKGKSDKFVVGYIGAMRKRKNLEFGVKAANFITDPKIAFDIWGKKSFEYEYLAGISKNNNLSFKGFAPEEKLVETYDSFDAFIFPSFHEGFGFEILEAQARGLPVITYKDGKIPDEVRKYCFEAESPEHMAQIIENIKGNGYGEKSKKRAADYARSFTWERCADETLKAYGKALRWPK